MSEPEEYLMPPALAERMLAYQQKVQKAQAAMREAALVAISALGVEGQGLSIQIVPEPMRFVITRAEAPASGDAAGS